MGLAGREYGLQWRLAAKLRQLGTDRRFFGLGPGLLARRNRVGNRADDDGGVAARCLENPLATPGGDHAPDGQIPVAAQTVPL
ncbi:hypothetical protein SDC9_204423 [bioreactor metagenome]|uniref:Uncharacterized protein n=1 Tax=bioreactor metagenome TaxID=1076179 RepID=A0A645IZI5_9ZZZZ